MPNVVHVECRTQTQYADCRYAKCRYAECRGAPVRYDYESSNAEREIFFDKL